MVLADEIKRFLLEREESIRVSDVRVGLRYTAVMLENGKIGLSYTWKDSEHCSYFQRSQQNLAGRKASELLEFLGGRDRLSSSLGLATANALQEGQDLVYQDGDVLEFVKLNSQDRVGMVGYFAPLVPAVRKRVGSLAIFEENENLRMEGAFSPDEAYKVLPTCDVVLLTATSIINRTVDRLLECCGKCREVVMLGASTPLLPKAFHSTPVTLLSGVKICKPAEILRIVSEGGGMSSFKGFIRKVNVQIQG